jgi:hypothetical protein
MRFVWLVFLVIVFCDADAQVLRVMGTRSTACGGCLSVMVGPECFPDNPAALARQNDGFIAFDAANSYLLPASTTFVAGGAVAVYHTNLSLGIAYSGDEFFHETFVSAQASKCLFRTLLAGVRIKYHSLFQGDSYGKSHGASADAGLIWESSDKTAFGIFLCNPFSVSFSSDKSLSGIACVASGVCFHTGPHSLVIAEIEKMPTRPVNIKAGMEWDFSGHFVFRCGAQYATRMISFGCGFVLNNIRINIAVSNSLIPGSQFTFSSLYEFAKR